MQTNRQDEGQSSNRKAYATRLLLWDNLLVNLVAPETISALFRTVIGGEL